MYTTTNTVAPAKINLSLVTSQRQFSRVGVIEWREGGGGDSEAGRVVKEEPLLSENKVQTTGQVNTADILTEDTGKGRTIGTHRGLITQQDTEHRGFNQQWVKTVKVGWKITESNYDDAQEKHT